MGRITRMLKASSQAKSVAPSSPSHETLIGIMKKDPQLMVLVGKWPKLPKDVRAAILKLLEEGK